MIEITEPEEAVYILHTGGGWPVGYSLDFDRVHADNTVTDYHSKIFHFSLVELTFGWFEEEVEAA